jgi:putative hydrolase of the HAD superfamily
VDVAHIDTWIFDLDNTLYRPNAKVFEQIDARMKAFISRELGVDHDEAFAIQKRYFRDFGTTLRGLMNNHGTAPDAFLEFVHDIDHSVLDRDDALCRAMGELPGRKIVFTNGTISHAAGIMGRLGVTDHVEAVFDIRAANYLPKPNVQAYRALLERYQVDPARAAMFEDLHANLKPAAALGMVTVWVHPDPATAPAHEVDHCRYRTDDLAAWLAAAAENCRGGRATELRA